MSIDEDIGILEQRANMIRERLAGKKEALKNMTSLTLESEEAYRKLKESTKLLLVSLRRECKKVDDVMGGAGYQKAEEENS